MWFFHRKPPATLLPVNNSPHHDSSLLLQEPNPLTIPVELTQPSQHQTRYMDMLLSLDTVPRSHNILASLSTWILLAGFLIIPGTFTSVEKSQMIQQEAKQNAVAGKFLDEVKHASLLYIAFACCLIGSSGVMWLWWRWRSNYVWLINKIFIVVAFNSIAGLISTLINVYSQQGGRYSITAKVTVVVTGSCAVFTAVLFLLYNFCILELVKRKHSEEVGVIVEK